MCERPPFDRAQVRAGREGLTEFWGTGTGTGTGTGRHRAASPMSVSQVRARFPLRMT
ncbi:MAG: hypothetical protein AVDCRST_MAG75-2283 [uncultured Propionibacteriaceae bacterium]|uniref:Uncharacterized protein n=1 Tax=uncultured Propionibacteriaceae bacterium TaxID=257457 RepID=A0A6J4P5L7_9ACTN|nr:MAG: hypothetical protein AVDCRST_MAG75-2283 [uncultured Propionibacteriaceae bacterium]